ACRRQLGIHTSHSFCRRALASYEQHGIQTTSHQCTILCRIVSIAAKI
ncbi:MAG: hypothetical protein AVDCRST_MAG93-234, partial [uncultured Chloroflexia bacterium]